MTSAKVRSSLMLITFSHYSSRGTIYAVCQQRSNPKTQTLTISLYCVVSKGYPKYVISYQMVYLELTANIRKQISHESVLLTPRTSPHEYNEEDESEEDTPPQKRRAQQASPMIHCYQYRQSLTAS